MWLFRNKYTNCMNVPYKLAYFKPRQERFKSIVINHKCNTDNLVGRYCRQTFERIMPELKLKPGDCRELEIFEVEVQDGKKTKTGMFIGFKS